MMFTDLPWELESDILSRVSPNSLTKLKTTCKRWYSLFKDPSFIKENSQRNAAATQLVLKKDKSVYSLNIDLDGIHDDSYDQSIQFTGKLRSLRDLEDINLSEIFHCGSLLLCLLSTTKGNRLVVWNPCTGQTRWIIHKRYTIDHRYFLGYENNNNKKTYKILSFSSYGKDLNAAEVYEYEIYEFNSDSWRVLDDVDCFSLWEGGVSLNGNTYWLDLDGEEEEDPLANFILKFDFTTERFRRQPLPFESDDAILSVVGEEKLAVLHQKFDYDIPILEMKIWMTNNTKTDEGKDFSWTKFLVVDFYNLLNYGMTREMTKVMTFLVDEENKRVMCCDSYQNDDKTHIYIVGEDIYKQIYEELASPTDDDPVLLSYVPSLVQIPAKESKHGGKRKR